MLRAKMPALDCKRLARMYLALGRPARVVEGQREVVERTGHIGMIIAEQAASKRQRISMKRLPLRKSALSLNATGQDIQRRRHIRVFPPEKLFLHGDCLSNVTLCFDVLVDLAAINQCTRKVCQRCGDQCIRCSKKCSSQFQGAPMHHRSSRKLSEL